MYLKTALLILSLGFINSIGGHEPALTSYTSSDHHRTNVLQDPKFHRYIVLAENHPWMGLCAHLDSNHQSAFDSGICTYQELNTLDAAAFDFFHKKYGYDFSKVIPDADGRRIIMDVGVAFPSIKGLDKTNVLICDSKHSNRGDSHKWYSVEISHVIFFKTTGTVPEGAEFAGAQFQAGDQFIYGKQILLKNKVKNSRSKKHREEFDFSTTNLSKQATSQHGNRQFIFNGDMTDRKGRKGVLLGVSAINQIDGKEVLQTRTTITWDCDH